MTVSDILGRGVSIEWHEGVALVRSVATRLVETSSHVPAAPELDQIEMSNDGDVRVTGGTITPDPVRRLGQLLQATLGHAQVPVQLRLVIVQATAPTPVFGSIREFDEALGYFERPGRATILQSLYARAAASSPVPAAGPAPTLDAVAPLPSPDPPRKSKRRPPTNRRTRAGVMAVAAVLVLFGAAVALYARRGGPSVGKRDVSAIARKASDAVGAAALAGLSAVTERTGLGHLVAANAVSAEAPAVPDTPAPKVSRPRSALHRLDPPTPPIVILDLDPLSHSDAELVAVASETSVTPSSAAAEAVERDENTIFSPESEGVSPPVGVRPQLPRALPPNVKPEQLCRVELIVSEAGTVESLKLLGTPRNVHEFMLVSAAKAWQFHPAVKDGRPVRFRKTMWLVSQ